MADILNSVPDGDNFINLKEIPSKDVRSEVPGLFIPGEEIVQCFQTIRDQVIFTNKRVLVVNVQGVTGTRVSYFSYPYSKIQYYGVSTAGTLDIDSEMLLAFSNGSQLKFSFRASVDIKKVCGHVSKFTL